jgi:hypothetical protein
VQGAVVAALEVALARTGFVAVVAALEVALARTV